MATEITKQVLSGSTDGAPIAVLTTSTTLHTAHASNIDEVWIYATVPGATDRTLTLTVDGATLLVQTITKQTGLVLILPGVAVTGSVVVAATGDAEGINVTGWVNRIAQS